MLKGKAGSYIINCKADYKYKYELNVPEMTSYFISLISTFTIS